jgi:hypothetical protein
MVKNQKLALCVGKKKPLGEPVNVYTVKPDSKNYMSKLIGVMTLLINFGSLILN